MATTITVSELNAQFGDYYISNSANMSRIHQQIMDSGNTEEAFTLEPTEDTVLRYSEAEVGSVLQPYQDTFTPKGAVNFVPAEIPLRQIKVDQKFNPNALASTWVGFLASNKLKREEWPFVRWFIESYLIPKIKEERELEVIYKGSYLAPTAGTPGAAKDSVNGIRKIINADITASNITPITTGAMSTDPVTFVGQIETFIKAIPEKYWATSMDLNMSRALALRFRNGMRTKYNTNYESTEDLSTLLDFPVVVKGRASMIGSAKIWMTPKINARRGLKWGNNANLFAIQGEDRNVKIWTDWFEGFGYVIPGLVFTNDQDLV